MNLRPADPLATGAAHLARGDAAAAAQIADTLLLQGTNAGALFLLAQARRAQQRQDEAAALLTQCLALQPDKTQAWIELGELQQARGNTKDAIESFTRALALEPQNLLAQLSLGVALKDHGELGQAEMLLADGMEKALPAPLKTGFAYNLAFAEYDQGKKQEALKHFTLAARLEHQPDNRASLNLTRAALLEELQQPQSALSVLEENLCLQPLSCETHRAYNDLLYRQGHGDFLASYNRAPAHAPLQLGKARFLLDADRALEAQAVYAAILARCPDNDDAVIGLSQSLNRLGEHGQALARLEQIAPRRQQDVGFLANLSAAALQAGDAQKGEAMAARALVLDPLHQQSLALMGSAWRLMCDARDERLNGYDDLIQSFDLEPPQGFSSMADFNLELGAWLSSQHGDAQAPPGQSLRSGSQTRGRLFASGHDLVERLKPRIEAAIASYIANMKADASHPFIGRKTGGFTFKGSWSSRLRANGFHVNHVHPEGWISSCYYVDVPGAANDGQQGWIKFGEPGYDIGLEARRAIKPAPGRLVLFPSYMWHGTVPFQGHETRTTIAFDALPR